MSLWFSHNFLKRFDDVVFISCEWCCIQDSSRQNFEIRDHLFFAILVLCDWLPHALPQVSFVECHLPLFHTQFRSIYASFSMPDILTKWWALFLFTLQVNLSIFPVITLLRSPAFLCPWILQTVVTLQLYLSLWLSVDWILFWSANFFFIFYISL